MIDLYTERLYITDLRESDASFIMKLLNSVGWLKFIGDKNIGSIEAAEEYIKKIRETPEIVYTVVQTREGAEAMGIVTLVKKDYLPDHDLGFAFLNDFHGQGFAFEACWTVLEYALTNLYTHVSAVVLPDNEKSIRLLVSLGFNFVGAIKNANEELLHYRISNAKVVVSIFFVSFQSETI